MLPFILVLSNCGFLGTIALWQRKRRGWFKQYIGFLLIKGKFVWILKERKRTTIYTMAVELRIQLPNRT